jgi:LacI family transcriptional regulator
MGKSVPAGSEVGIVTGMLSAEDHRKKTEGFSETFPKYSAGGRILEVIEGHEAEKESLEKTHDLLGRFPKMIGLYVNTVNCLPVCRALEERGLAGKVRLVATDLFPEMAAHLDKGTITASIYQHPFRQSQIAVRLLADHLAHKLTLSPCIHLSPGVVMASNYRLFREMRLPERKLDI